jgi:hypothetical protein
MDSGIKMAQKLQLTYLFCHNRNTPRKKKIALFRIFPSKGLDGCPPQGLGLRSAMRMYRERSDAVHFGALSHANKT